MATQAEDRAQLRPWPIAWPLHLRAEVMAMTKSGRIVVRLESEMRAKPRERSAANGLDEAACVRMLIYRDINGHRCSGAELPR
jgi:hypothetical protein